MDKHTALNAIGHGINCITAERVKHVTKHGHTPESDAQYQETDLITYAKYWLSEVQNDSFREFLKSRLQKRGFAESSFGYDGHTAEQRLAKAGALIAAQIDMLHFKAQTQLPSFEEETPF